MASLPAGITRTALATTLAVALRPPPRAQTLLTKAPANFDDLVKAAKDEGELTVIACPHDWVNYGEIFTEVHRQVRHQDQRAEPGRQLGRGDRGHQGQQGQQGPPGSGRGRRGPVLRPPDEAGQKLLAPYMVQDLEQHPRQRSRTRTATGSATTTAPWPSK